MISTRTCFQIYSTSSKLNKATYALSGTTLTVQVQGANDAITINNFNKGNLGITLNDTTQNIGFSISGIEVVPYSEQISTKIDTVLKQAA